MEDSLNIDEVYLEDLEWMFKDEYDYNNPFR
jgi:hypothetical protein